MTFPLSAAAVPRLIVLDAVGSTNSELAARAARAGEEDLPDLTVLVTRDQTAGRGRLDRMWTAPPGSALAISVLLRAGSTPPAALSWLPLVGGLAMAATVAAALPARSVGVKWPNDVLVGERKICGVLAESGPAGVVLGAGLNVEMREDELPVPTATSLLVEGAEVDDAGLDALLARYLREVTSRVAELRAGRSLAAELRAACVTLGRRVRVEFPDGRMLDGTAIGVLDDGRLRVRSDDGAVETVSAGDVTHARLV